MTELTYKMPVYPGELHANAKDRITNTKNERHELRDEGGRKEREREKKTERAREEVSKKRKKRRWRRRRRRRRRRRMKR